MDLDISGTGIDVDFEAQRLKTLRDYCVLDTGREKRFDDIALLAARVCAAPIALISLVDSGRLYFKAAVGIDAQEAPFPDAFCGRAILGRDVFVVSDSMRDERFRKDPLVTGKPHIRFYAGAPLVSPDGHAIGTLCVIDRVPRALTTQQGEALQILSNQVVAQLELGKQLIRDPLTGLFSRRHMEETLANETRRMARKQLPLGVILFDLDHFKRVNDNFGRDAGAAALKAVGDLIASSVRGEDTPCRYSGQEFAVILPEAPLDITRLRAEQMCRKIKQLKVPLAQGVLEGITVSAGVAAFPDHGVIVPELMHAAEQALHAAKNGGRDRVVVSAASRRPPADARAAGCGEPLLAGSALT